MRVIKVLFVAVLCVHSVVSVIVNLNVTRRINLEGTMAQIDIKILFLDKDEDVAYYDFILEDLEEEYQLMFRNELSESLDYKFMDNNGTSGIFRVNLKKNVPRNQLGYLFVNIVDFDSIEPYETRTFEDDQRFMFWGNILYNSVYNTIEFENRYVLKTENIISLSIDPSFQEKNQIIYNYADLEPYSSEEFVIEYINNDPLLIVSNLHRTIDVSQYGKIFVKDQIVLKHEGPALVGPYEPRIFQKSKTAASWLYTHLPASAHQINLFDEIGTIYSTEFTNLDTHITMKFKTRYPLLGGWKITYNLCYLVPNHEYLYEIGEDRYQLKMRAVDHVLNDVFIKNAEVNILLPDGAELEKAVIPKPYVNLMNDWEYTSLSIFGRPSITFNGGFLVDDNISDFKITYKIPYFYFLKIPLLIALYFKVVFVSVIFVLRLL